MDFKSNIKSLCKLRGITQKELADKIGITNSALNISLSKNNPRFSTLESIAEALGVNVAQLLISPDEQPQQPDQQPAEENAKALRCPHCGEEIELYVKAL